FQGVSANVDGTSTKKHEKFVPLVAFECGYRNKYMSEDGVWAYPKLNITNIVEYSHEVAIEKWCREEGTPCKWTHTVRPYQCIDGEFKSEALQVPHDCRFSHVNSGESCNDYQHWRDEAAKQCSAKTFNGKGMTVRSFAVLEPCSLDLFTGVEFVCCPTVVVGARTIEKANKLPLKEEDDDDDEYDDEYDGSDEDASDEKSSEGQDPYFKSKDPVNEHENFKDAEERLDKKHREKIEKVMKEWGELEARYQQMKLKDTKGAESFKVSMTNRFQKTVASLEDEHKRLKKQLEATHEERVQAILNEKKRTATHDYRQALAMHDKSANKHHVLKTLKTYIRSEEKDRIHTINRYRHLLRVDQAEAAAFKPTVHRPSHQRHFGYASRLPRSRKPIAYWSDFRRENTPELSDAAIDALNSLDSDAKNKKLVDLYKPHHRRRQLLTRPPKPLLSEDSRDSEEDDDEYYEDEDDEEVKKNPIIKKPKIIEIQRKEDVKKVEAPKLVEKSVQTDPLPTPDDSDSDESEEDEDSIKELRVDIEPIIEEKPAYYRQEKLIQNQVSYITFIFW
ncbi:unnamed protein product, partial [Strongylus vulgaris]